MKTATASHPLPRLTSLSAGNHAKLPARLRISLESVSGLDMSDVRVHYNSDKPHRLAAAAYTFGLDIFLTVGAEDCLPHEAWHVVQQKQGRVPAVRLRDGLPLNDDPSLETEADLMGAMLLTMPGSHIKNKFRQVPVGRWTPVAQCTLGKDYHTTISNLTELNNAIAQLVPAVAPLVLATFAVAGASMAMVNAAINQDRSVLYDGMTQADVAATYTAALAGRVNTTAPVYQFEHHGMIHFPGGTAKDNAKFTGRPDQVNPLLEGIMTQQIGRMRRHTTTDHSMYYFTFLPARPQQLANYCRNSYVAIQLTYSRVTDTISYHGYPDIHIRAPKLAPTRDGAAIP